MEQEEQLELAMENQDGYIEQDMDQMEQLDEMENQIEAQQMDPELGDQQPQMTQQEQMYQTRQAGFPNTAMMMMQSEQQPMHQTQQMPQMAQSNNISNFITDDFLQVLDEHRKICEKGGKLNEAMAARKRLRELKIVNENRKREQLIQSHQSDMQSLENAHIVEIKELLAKWNNIIIPNFENEASLLELELKKRQQNELELFRMQVESEQKTQKIYYSSEVLNLKRQCEVLGNQGAYKDAKVIKKKMKESQKFERAKQTNQSREKLMMKSQMLVQQHSKEMANLKKKHASQRKGLAIQKQKEFDIIEKRFVNVWNELESKFRKDMLELEKQDSVKKMKLKEDKLTKRIVSY